MPTLPAILGALPAARRAEIIRAIPDHQLRALNAAFPEWAHPGQLAPPGDWRTWVIMAGRGFGKTRAGAEWVLSLVRGDVAVNPPRQRGGGGETKSTEGQPGGGGLQNETPPNTPLHRASEFGVGLPPAIQESAGGTFDPKLPLPAGGEDLQIALVAATADEARRIMVEGPSGLLALARRDEIVSWEPSRRLLRFAGGAEARLYSGASPESLRGPQHHVGWCDELAKWRHSLESWHMLQMGLRLGARPRALVTTTPRAGAALRHILSLPDTVQTGGPTQANRFLPAAFIAAMEADYGGSRLGAQEIGGELIADIEGSLWPLDLIAASRARLPAMFERVVVGVDPPASAAGTCGIMVCGVADGTAYVIEDASLSGASPERWARRVADAAASHSVGQTGASRIVAEANQGGAMVETLLRQAAPDLRIAMVHAHASKGARAEPVAALFEAGRAKLGGEFPALEAQLTAMTAAQGYHEPGSPDRADAMVWALWALMIDRPRAEPSIRAL